MTLTYIRTEIFRIWSRVFLHIAVQVLVIVVITLLIVRWSLAGPIARMAQWMKALRTGRHAIQPTANDLDLLSPLRERWRHWRRACGRHVQRQRRKPDCGIPTNLCGPPSDWPIMCATN